MGTQNKWLLATFSIAVSRFLMHTYIHNALALAILACRKHAKLAIGINVTVVVRAIDLSCHHIRLHQSLFYQWNVFAILVDSANFPLVYTIAHFAMSLRKRVANFVIFVIPRLYIESKRNRWNQIAWTRLPTKQIHSHLYMHVRRFRTKFAEWIAGKQKTCWVLVVYVDVYSSNIPFSQFLFVVFLVLMEWEKDENSHLVPDGVFFQTPVTIRNCTSTPV